MEEGRSSLCSFPKRRVAAARVSPHTLAKIALECESQARAEREGLSYSRHRSTSSIRLDTRASNAPVLAGMPLHAHYGRPFPPDNGQCEIVRGAHQPVREARRPRI